MLYYKQNLSDTTCLGIWKIEETIDNLLSKLEHKEWLNSIDTIKFDKRKKVVLATRLLLKELIGEEKQVCYLESGRPYLIDHSWNISISHTQNYVAVVVDAHNTLGLDIEQRANKVLRVRERFLADDDYIDQSNELTHLLLHWSAKEAMFKYLDTQSIDFREDLHIHPFIPQESGMLEIWESITSEQKKYDAHYMATSEFVLVCISA